MKKNTYKKIPTQKAKEFLEIYKTVKKHQERINAILNKKDDYAVSEINNICKQLDKLAKLKRLTHSVEIKEMLTTDFIQSISYWDIKKDFDTKEISITEEKKLMLKGKHGRPKKDYALDFLIYLLASECGNDLNLIAAFLEDNEIAGEDENYSIMALKKRLNRINRDNIKKLYGKFAYVARNITVDNSGDTLNINISYELPYFSDTPFPLK